MRDLVLLGAAACCLLTCNRIFVVSYLQGGRWEVEGGRWEMGGAVEGPEEELRVSTG